jgi:hypothetical protein
MSENVKVGVCVVFLKFLVVHIDIFISSVIKISYLNQ